MEEVEFEIEEGMTIKDFKKQKSRQKQKDKRAADKIAPTRRAGIHADKASPERAARHRANVDPDFEGNDERNYPGGKLNPKKVRKAKALGELGEQQSQIDELNRYEKETGKDYKTGKPSVKGGTMGDSDTTSQALRSVMRSMGSGRLGVQSRGKKKEPGKKPPAAGKYGSERRSPAQQVAINRAAAQRAKDNMSSRFD
jgi:hypothetical protein